MNVYDFDKTIYVNDSTKEFYLYCLKKYPVLILLAPAHLSGFPGYLLGLRKKTRAKERFYSFLKYIPDIDLEIKMFWESRMGGIKKWYLEKKKEDDLVISASPEFIVGEACSRLGIEYMASRVDKKTGKYSGENCHGEEKVRRFYEAYPEGEIEEFYSDSLNDTPLAKIARKAYLVDKNEIKKWEE